MRKLFAVAFGLVLAVAVQAKDGGDLESWLGWCAGNTILSVEAVKTEFPDFYADNAERMDVVDFIALQVEWNPALS